MNYSQFEKDDDVLNTMSAVCGEHSIDMWTKLATSDRTDYRTATYLLLLDRKLRGLSLKVTPVTRSYLRPEAVGVVTFFPVNIKSIYLVIHFSLF